MAEPVLDSLKKLVSQVSEGVTNDVRKRLELCWKEFYQIEKDPDIPMEVYQKTRTVIEEITVALEAYEAGAITVKEFNRIKTKILEE
ncbi:MAG: hypothetical protein ACTSUQ_13805 [Candidatus Freyarchaeota archaeon]